MSWWELILAGLVDQLDKAIKGVADLTDISDNKHYMTGLWLVKRYKPEAARLRLISWLMFGAPTEES